GCSVRSHVKAGALTGTKLLLKIEETVGTFHGEAADFRDGTLRSQPANPAKGRRQKATQVLGAAHVQSHYNRGQVCLLAQKTYARGQRFNLPREATDFFQNTNAFFDFPGALEQKVQTIARAPRKIQPCARVPKLACDV